MNAFTLLSLDEVAPCQDLCDKLDELTRFQPSRRFQELDLGLFNVVPEYFFPYCLEFARPILREILSTHLSNSPNGIGELDTRGLQRCIGTFYDGNRAWLSEWIVAAREFFHGRADAMEFTDPVDAIAPVPQICRRGMYSEMAFIYKVMLATKMVWAVLVLEQPSINALLTSSQRTLMDLVEVPELLLKELMACMPELMEEIRETCLDEDEHHDEGGDFSDSKTLENAEMAMVMHFLLREANINQCDMTAVTRLTVALSGRGYDNLYKKIRDPFQGNQRMVLKRMLRIKPLIEDLRNESIMLKFNKEMQKLRI
ncbi:MAG: hypothetical protein P8N56_00640 [Schleiferiaceae bacterium]|nr:hypothetical protein [Schleiferiaceae bacterium]